MNDRERLEEIKQTINHPNYTEHNGQEEIYFMVSDNDFNWLIKQAERVEDLENENRILRTVAESNKYIGEQYLEQNKRYREALEEIKEVGRWGMYTDKYARIAQKALEGDEW